MFWICVGKKVNLVAECGVEQSVSYNRWTYRWIQLDEVNCPGYGKG
jgi:hypothetical protein